MSSDLYSILIAVGYIAVWLLFIGAVLWVLRSRK